MTGPELLIYWLKLWVMFCFGGWFLERLIANLLYLLCNGAFKAPKWLRRLAARFTRPL